MFTCSQQSLACIRLGAERDVKGEDEEGMMRQTRTYLSLSLLFIHFH